MRINRTRLTIYTSLAVLVCAIVGTAQHARHAQYEPTVIKLKGKPEAMGSGYGKEQKNWIRMLLLFYIEKGVCGGNERIIKTRKRQSMAIFEKMDPRWLDELTALSKASSANREMLAVGNSFLDLGSAPVGCRTFLVRKGDSLLHAHNLDWNNLSGMARMTMQIIRREPEGRFRTVSLCYPGMIGSLDVINEHGVCLSFNQLGMGKGNSDIPVFIMMRDIAETCKTYDDARKRVLEAPATMPFIITLSGSKSGNGAVFERATDGETAVVERKLNSNGRAAAANAKLGADGAGTPMYQVLSEIEPADVTGVKRVLRHKRVLMDINIYSAIFDFKSNKLHLASGKIPAAKYEYRTFTLFD